MEMTFPDMLSLIPESTGFILTMKLEWNAWNNIVVQKRLKNDDDDNVAHVVLD